MSAERYRCPPANNAEPNPAPQTESSWSYHYRTPTAGSISIFQPVGPDAAAQAHHPVHIRTPSWTPPTVGRSGSEAHQNQPNQPTGQRLQATLRSSRATGRMSRHSINQQIRSFASPAAPGRHARTGVPILSVTLNLREVTTSVPSDPSPGRAPVEISFWPSFIGRPICEHVNLRRHPEHNHVRRILRLCTQRHAEFVFARISSFTTPAGRGRQTCGTQGTTHRTNTHQRRQDIREVLHYIANSSITSNKRGSGGFVIINP